MDGPHLRDIAAVSSSGDVERDRRAASLNRPRMQKQRERKKGRRVRKGWRGVVDRLRKSGGHADTNGESLRERVRQRGGRGEEGLVCSRESADVP